MSSILTAAKALAAAGIASIAVGEDKRPFQNWREYQVRIPNDMELDRTMKTATALAIVAGQVLCIDIDEKCDPTKTIFARYKTRCEEAGLGELWARATIQQTKNKGYHLVFRVEDQSVRNEKLATLPDRSCLIETRGQGGYFVAYPSPGYTLMQGDFTALPLFSSDERDALLDAARSLSEQPPAEAPAPKPTSNPVARAAGDITPGDDYDARGDINALLRDNGWTAIRDSKLWTRPGKKHGISASWGHIPERFYVFTSSTCFEPMHTYKKWHVFAHLECGGDFAEAAKRLRAMGFGGKSERKGEYTGMRLGAQEFQSGAEEDAPPIGTRDDQPAVKKRPLPPIYTLDEEEEETWARPPELIHGLLYQGAKGMLAGPSKAKKTYLLTDLAISVAGGVPWLGFQTTQRNVLYLNLELQPFAFRDRRRAIVEAKLAKSNVPGLYTMHGRGHSLSWQDLFVDLPAICRAENIGLIIVDPVYKLNQGSGDENKASDVGVWLNGLEAMAHQTGAAIVFAHHYAKGDASNKNAIDRMSGSGVWARDPDALISFTPHKEEDCMVLDCSLRNFAPQPPFVVRWNYPIWERDVTLNASELKEADAKGGRAKGSATIDLATLNRALAERGGKLTRTNASEVAEVVGCSERTLWRHYKKFDPANN